MGKNDIKMEEIPLSEQKEGKKNWLHAAMLLHQSMPRT
jgi:hypothetical protein